jgi:two-component system CheB/CheR fusion protein
VDDEPGAARLPIVGIGASAGGIEAFRGFFENMPPDSGMGFVVVLHLPVNRKSILRGIISRWTSMEVIEAEDGCALRPNCVYVPPAGVGVVLRKGRLHLQERDLDEPREPSPISTFFDSLASALREDAIGVVLSGTGNDGALGLKAIKARGGLTLAQGSAQGNDGGPGPQHDGMPMSAIATGAVDIVAPVEAMPARIIAAQNARRHPDELADQPSERTDGPRRAICEVLQRQLGHDFSGYKEKTFLRRVQRRMQVTGAASLEQYASRLKDDRLEVAMLFQDLLIGVTAFFRDADTFEELGRTIVPRLFEGKAPSDTVRVWVPGCATGEEAYSLAMLLRERADALDDGAPKIQVFATDIDDSAIAAARAGTFPASLLQGVSAERLARFFTPGSDGSYTVGKDVRAVCTFSAHSLTRDPPFSRIDMVSCRNLLIYLDTELQDVVIPAFHYSLAPGGLLLLGSSESVSRHEGLFAPVDKARRIYRRLEGPSPPLQLRGATPRQPPSTESRAPTRAGSVRATQARITRAGTRVLERFAPPFVVAAADGEIVQYSARTGRFLEPAAGLPSQNVLDLARPGLRVQLRAALQQAIETGAPVRRDALSVIIPGDGVQTVSLAVEPLPEQEGAPCYLIVFLEEARRPPASKAEPSEAGEPDAGATAADGRLEAELRDTREQLQSVTEEHETAVEELRSANEELHSVNEELQSANEELETSKEEIQSINEELQTVNGELASKVDELDRKNTDLQNLFESTQVATVFLDPYLVIRGFTPAVASIYNLIPSDQGRPLTDIVSRVAYGSLREDVAQVLRTLEPLERRVARDDGRTHYLMRILPYRTPDSAVDGTIVTFVDVTSIVQAEEHQRLLVDELNHRVKNMLTVVVSLAMQTMRRSDSLEEFSKSYLGRIDALTAAYSLLSSEAWQPVPLRDVVMEEVKPFLAGEPPNIVLQGPHVLLEPRAALALGIAIHELTTNAVKYGALSVPDGAVGVTWRVEQRQDGQTLMLDWQEQNGPPVSEPESRGFGMMLIERGLRQDMSAEVEIDFAAGGVRARLQAPLGAPPSVTGSAGTAGTRSSGAQDLGEPRGRRGP